MKKTFSIFMIIAAGLLLVSASIVNSEKGQDFLFQRLVKVVMTPPADIDDDSLRIFVCGSSSPLLDLNRAQACIAVVTRDHFYIVDAGAGSMRNLGDSRLPMQRLDGILLTHFHSDHIAAIPDMNLNSWAQGRPAPLTVYGPAGVATVVAGLNQAYQLDRQYRVAHHGADLLPVELGKLAAEVVDPGVIVEQDGLTITAFAVDHEPVSPAVGYRIDYRGRSVVVSGDTIVTDEIIAVTRNVDLVLIDALSLPIVKALERTVGELGMDRNARILHDIQDYHALTSDIAALASQGSIKQVALYHMVPPPRNYVMEKIFLRGLPENVVLTEDRMWFTLPAGSNEIEVRFP